VTSVTTNVGRRVIAAVLGLAVLGLAACHRTPGVEGAPDADASEPAAKSEAAPEGVTLSAEQVDKLGVVTQQARATDYTSQVVGYGLVITHDAIATAVAELETAQAAQDQSRAAAARAQRLAGTPGAMSADTVETSVRQVATDTAARALAEHRLSGLIGAGPPGGLAAGSLLPDLASGKAKLMRATFPLGALPGAIPPSLRAVHLDASSSSAGWTLQPVWAAPADASLPGRSFFAVLKDGDAGEGERLLVWAPGTGPPLHGVIVPSAAVVISGGKFWCYVQRKPGVYVRREVATDRPVADGYVVTEGIDAGEHVVTSAAGLLLAREMNPSTEAD
jgi:hypothetical protein